MTHPIRLFPWVWILLAAVAVPTASQELARPELRGLVTVGDSTPAAGATVVLHRVDAADAGEIDSVRAAPDGTFRLSLPTVPDPGGRGEVYFASVRHQGVLYFGPPVTTAIQLDSVYAVQVYDTVVAPAGGARLPTRVRYLLAEPLEEGWQITDLVQIQVPGDRTWVAADSGTTWSYRLPEGQRDLEVGGGDVPPSATRVEGGILRVDAPLPPGLRQVVVRYVLDSLTVDVPVPGGVEEMDFLIREPAPPVEVGGLLPAESVEMEGGVRYRRFTGSSLPDTVLRVRELPPGFELPTRWVAVVLALALALVGIRVVARSPAGAGRGPESGPAESAPGSRARLIREVAEIDEALEDLPDGPKRRRLQGRRRHLVAKLRAGE